MSPRRQTTPLCIPAPSTNVVTKYIEYWDKNKSMKHYRKQEELIEHLFNPENPTPNDDPVLVLEKVCVLESFYSTNLVKNGLDALVRMAEFICGFKSFDDRLKEGNVELIDEIVRRWKKQNEENKYCLSFATKYCFHHNRQKFYIYDNKVMKMLRHFKNDFKNPFTDMQLKRVKAGHKDHRDVYKCYHDVYEQFMSHYFESNDIPDYGNQRCRNWCVDKYLWMLGKGILLGK